MEKTRKDIGIAPKKKKKGKKGKEIFILCCIIICSFLSYYYIYSSNNIQNVVCNANKSTDYIFIPSVLKKSVKGT